MTALGVLSFPGSLLLLLSAASASLLLFGLIPREPYPSEKTYKSIDSEGRIVDQQPLSCWQDTCSVEEARGGPHYTIEDAQVAVTLVVPAYNEQDRIGPMLEEAVAYLAENFSKRKTRRKAGSDTDTVLRGWEVLVVSDGSTDATEQVVLDFAKAHETDAIRVITLKTNRGKGGAVVHGMRHARGSYVVFADADGASTFADLGKLIAACDAQKDTRGRVVGIGSRAHLVGSAAVVNRSALRNFLMHSFHLLLWALTPPATSRIRDTQCGFKLFSRESLPYIVPSMRSEGWIFDVELLMLAERAAIPMAEVPIGWHEVTGSKLNVVVDSIGMAYGLALLRLAWALGVYTVVDPRGRPLGAVPYAGTVGAGGLPRPY